MTDAPKPPDDKPATPAPAAAVEKPAAPAATPPAAAAAKPAAAAPAAPPKPPAKPAPVVPPTEEHYKISTLNLVFLISSVLCFAAFGLMVYKDWKRDWKDTQKTFQTVLKRRAKADKLAAEKMLSESQRKTLDAELAAAKKSVEENKARLTTTQREWDAVKIQASVSERAYQDAKANVDSQRYLVESINAEKGVEEAGSANHKLQKLLAVMNAKSEETKAFNARAAELERQVKELKKPLTDAAAAQLAAEGKISRLDMAIEKLTPSRGKKLLLLALNTPLLDFAAPPYEIKQAQLPDFHQDLNFQTTGTVDRCQTCHLAIDRPGFEFELDNDGNVVKGKDGKPLPMTQPFRSHPHLELFMGSSSAHKLEEFGCTSCHSGRDRGLDFVSAAHTPQDENQAAQWKAKYDWQALPSWELPMLPLQSTGAKCNQCHAGQSSMVMKTKDGLRPVSNNWTKGRDLFEKFGCWGCHKAQGYENLRKVGPDLSHLATKLDRAWVMKWVNDPFSFRHNTRMPAFFNQPNNGGPELTDAEIAEVKSGHADENLKARDAEHRRTHAELSAIVDVLYAKSTPLELPKPALPAGSAESGKALFYKIGCAGCHVVSADEKAAGRPEGRGAYGRFFGPSLDGIGSKANYDWIYAWVKNPRAYWPDTRMPDLRLTDPEAADISAWLLTLRNPAFEKQPAIAHDDAEIRTQLVEYFAGKGFTRDDAGKKVDAMAAPDRALMLGDKMLGRYGCYGCHNISGFETAQGIGVELYGASNEGNKPAHLLDFGFLANEKHAIPEVGPGGQALPFGSTHAINEDLEVEVPENFPLFEHDGTTRITRVRRVNLALHDWVRQKLLEPRIWDLGRQRGVEDRTKMPNFHFTPDEAEALAAVVMGFTKPMVAPERVMRSSGSDQLAEAARKYIQDRNCTGCHLYNGVYDPKNPNAGGAIRQIFPAVDNDATPEDESVTNPQQWPPYLTGEGAKAQTDWLHEFLTAPTMIRPKIKVRMPTFHFSENELNTLIAGWNYEARQPFPYAEAYDPAAHPELIARGREVFAVAQCKSCHAESAADLNREGVNAPNLELAHRRLKPAWLSQWLADPQAMAPGVNMPKFPWESIAHPNDPNETSEQRIEAIKTYVMAIGK